MAFLLRRANDLAKYHHDVKRRDMLVILLAMVAIAACALLANHYAFANKVVAPALPTTTTFPMAKAYRACAADGATISTAIAAFKAENPDLNPTESALVGGGLGGPYLQSWAYNPRFYNFTLTNGVLYLQAGTDGFLNFIAPPGVRFAGPKSCLKIGL